MGLRFFMNRSPVGLLKAEIIKVGQFLSEVVELLAGIVEALGEAKEFLAQKSRKFLLGGKKAHLPCPACAHLGEGVGAIDQIVSDMLVGVVELVLSYPFVGYAFDPAHHLVVVFRPFQESGIRVVLG